MNGLEVEQKQNNQKCLLSKWYFGAPYWNCSVLFKVLLGNQRYLCLLHSKFQLLTTIIFVQYFTHLKAEQLEQPSLFFAGQIDMVSHYLQKKNYCAHF